MSIGGKSNKVIEEKLIGLFKAIYTKDPNLNEITKDAFEWMKQKKISGNIWPHIKKAIQECLKFKKQEVDKIWIQELTITVGNEKQLKEIPNNVDSYKRVVNMLIDSYKLYDQSIDTIVEVWKEMLNSSSELKNTFYLLIMTEFVEAIWSDKNIKIVVEEIITHKDELSQGEPGDNSENINK